MADKFNSKYKATGYKITPNYVVVTSPKNGCSTVICQTLAFNENKDINYFSGSEYSHCIYNPKGDLFRKSDKYKINCDNVKYYPEQKVVYIFRDPVERFLSNYNQWHRNQKSVEKFINELCISFEKNKNSLENIELHCRPQYIDINFNDVNIFIELKDYKYWCEKNNIPWIQANFAKSNYKEEIILSEENINKIKELYKDDYELINKIKSSEKLYVKE